MEKAKASFQASEFVECGGMDWLTARDNHCKNGHSDVSQRLLHVCDPAVEEVLLSGSGKAVD